MSKVKETAKISVILFLITAIAALLLAFVNAKTAPLIAKNEEKKISDALKVVMPEAADFEKTEPNSIALSAAEKYDSDIIELYTAKGSDGSDTGICAIVETKGYDAGLRSAIGVDKNGTVTGVEIISHKETPGLGANAEKEEFRSQYIGKSGELEVVKTGAGDNEINAISGATLTSKGVTRAVNTVIEIASQQ
ncbi:MAG: RnfABCDGE type electron transport complex subunit G [Clostridia bacterium]|nr:RnfABCDGE type electron transport complex subunit G [Clostridia bacterium]